MLFNFQKHAENANLFLKEVALELDAPEDLDHAGRVLVAVLRTLRDRITTEESLHLISQLPMYIKAVYVDGWKPTKTLSNIKSVDDFLREVRSVAGRTAEADFSDYETTKNEVEAIFRVLRRHVSEGEIEDIKSQLPVEIAELLET